MRSKVTRMEKEHKSVKPASAFFSTGKKREQEHISTISSAGSPEVNPSLSSTESSKVNTDGNQSTKGTLDIHMKNEAVTGAEIRWALKVVMSNLSLSSCKKLLICSGQ